MGRKRKNLPVLENIEITDLGAEGKAIAKVDNMVVFVTGALPGDVVDLQVTRKKNKFMEASPVKFHKYSPDREEAFCEHFGVCGGCKWQDLPYSRQLFYKQKQVSDQLKRIGKLDLPEINPILPSEKTQFYRNKLEFTFTDRRWLTNEEIQSSDEIVNNGGVGFHIPKQFDKILDLNACYLQPDPSNAIRDSIKAFAMENNISFFNKRRHEGLLRTLIVRTASTGETMVIVSFYTNETYIINKILKHIEKEFPEITSIMYVVLNKGNDSITNEEVIVFSGRDHIFEEMEGLKFKIGPKSFYQTNSDQAYELYKVAREYAGLTGNEIVYDLYTGTGTIANFVAKSAKKVIGIEYVPEAIEDAKINSDLNSIKNTEFFAGDMREILTSAFIDEKGRPDVIILDPPRAGIHPDVVEALRYAAPHRIVYVSCNPATQARDLELLDDMYRVIAIQPVDMFPHTAHVENIVLIGKR